MNAIASIFSPRKTESAGASPAPDDGGTVHAQPHTSTSTSGDARADANSGALTNGHSGNTNANTQSNTAPLAVMAPEEPKQGSFSRFPNILGMTGDIIRKTTSKSPSPGPRIDFAPKKSHLDETETTATTPSVRFEPNVTEIDTSNKGRSRPLPFNPTTDDVATKEDVDEKSPAKSSPAKSTSQQTDNKKSSPSPRKPKEGRVTTSAAAPSTPQESHHDFTGFKSHRWDGNSIEMLVEWDAGPPTWEPEDSLQRDAPKALYSYWKSQGGRPANPRDPDMYEIFAILKHSGDRKRVLVQWTGYGPKDATWETRQSVEQTAPDVVKEYFEGVKEKPQAKGRGKGKSTTAGAKTKTSTSTSTSRGRPAGAGKARQARGRQPRTRR